MTQSGNAADLTELTRHAATQSGSVVVVGNGAAGLAAALRLAMSGCRVHVVGGGSGASSLSCGAIDRTPWEESAAQAESAPPAPDRDSAGAGDEVGEEAAELLEMLELYRVPAQGMLLATTSGILRPAHGADRALLDLKSVPRGAVLVPRCDHYSWDAVTLARSWGDTDIARASGLHFAAVDTTLTRYREERPLCDADLAARHDDPGRLGWLGERLREALGRSGPCVAVLLPPWLGIDAPRAEALSERVGLPCGEAACALASAAGRRFDRARDRALARANVDSSRAWVRRVAPSRPAPGAAWTIELEDGEPLEASAVVLAAGGLVGGGLAYEPSEALFSGEVPPSARPTFRATIDAPATLGAYGRPLDLPGSLFGVAPESLAWPFVRDPIMDRAGLLVDAHHRVEGAPGLFACGDLAADRPRTWLEAWTSGVRAGRYSLVASLRNDVRG